MMNLLKKITNNKTYIVDQLMCTVISHNWFYVKVRIPVDEFHIETTFPRLYFIKHIDKEMDISSKSSYPGSALSNFAPHPFMFRGFAVNSMEGFLQGLKFKSPEMQAEVFKLVGRAAKKKGAKKNWQHEQTLYFQGKAYKRNSKEYQDLLDEAYEALYKNDKFKRALQSTKGATLTHSMGKTKQNETILTRTEFCSRLTKLRDHGYLIEKKQEKLF